MQNQLAPILSEQTSPVYEFYIVNTDGVRYHLTDSFDFSDYMGDFNLGDFFEEERWLPKEDEGIGSFSRGQIIKVGAAGTAAGAAVFTNSLALKKGLINAVQGLFPNIKTQAPSTGGLLLQANYQVAETEVGSDARLNNIFIIGPGTDYNAMIKQAISQPAAIAAPINNMYHWEYLYIWVIKY